MELVVGRTLSNEEVEGVFEAGASGKCKD